MPSSYTDHGLTKQEPGENENSWGDILNDNVIELIDDGVFGRAAFTLSGPKTLTNTNGIANEARCAILHATSGSGGTVTVPTFSKLYVAINGTSGDMVITAGSAVVATIPAGQVHQVVSDGTDIYAVRPTAFGGAVLTGVGAPSADSHAATKKYVDDTAFAGFSGTFPGIPGNAGRGLTNDGVSSVLWDWVRTLGANVALSGAITPAQITANQNNYAPTGLADASTLRLSTDASRTITGLTGPAAGRLVVVENVGSFPLVLANESASSTAANRFSFGVDRTLEAGRAILLLYDATSARWRDVLATTKALAATIWAGADDERFTTPKALFDSAASVALTDAATIAVDGAAGMSFHVTLGGNRNLDNMTNAKPGQSGRFRITQDGTGGRTLLKGSNYRISGGSIVLSSAAGAVDVLSYYVHTATDIELYISRGLS